MTKQELIVVGYPRSGNTWLCRLLGDLLDCPVTGWGSAHPLAEEGAERQSDYLVRQLHLRPCVAKECNHTAGIVSAWEYCLGNKADNEHLLHIFRDPRDVAVSAMCYWEIENIETAVKFVANGSGPLEMVGRWRSFVEAWRDIPDAQSISYESLIFCNTDDAYQYIMQPVLKRLRIEKSFDEWMLSYNRQQIGNRREQVEREGDRLNYGRATQLKHLRKGTIGDWRNYFNHEAAKAAIVAWGDLLLDWYGVQPSWVEEYNVQHI